MSKLRFFFNTTKGKIYITILVTTVIMLAIFLPLLFLFDTGKKNYIPAYNRDSNSGTRYAFEYAINFDTEKQTYSKNVLEVSSNDSMITKVAADVGSIGYVSATSVYDYDTGEQLNDDIIILSFNGVDPRLVTEDGSLGYTVDDYDAARSFNMFFRIEEQYAEFIYDNMFFNKDNGNIWSPNGTWDDSSLTAQGINIDDILSNNSVNTQLSFIYSFAFFNWVLFSDEAMEILTFGISTDIYDPYVLTTTDLTNYFDNNAAFLSNYSSEEVVIYSQGSTSVSSVLNELFYTETIGFFAILETIPSANLISGFSYQNLNNGSGDAFSDDKVNNEHVWLGFQSRSLEASEAENFGYIIDESSATMPQDGFFYPSLTYTDGEWIPYYSFESDLIAFITNSETTYTDENGNEIHPSGITSYGVNLIYTQNMGWDDLYELGLLI